jgi:hypothetical protein
LTTRPQECLFYFIDVDENVRSELQRWPIIPSIGDVINTRAGVLLEVIDRHIIYGSELTIDVYVTKRDRARSFVPQDSL